MGSSRKGIAGRKPLPDEVKSMRGTLEKRREKGSIPGEKIDKIQQITSARGIRSLPTRRAKEIFKQKCNQVMGLKMLTEMDLENLAVYANNLDKILTLMNEIATEGDVITLYKVIYHLDGTQEQIPTKSLVNPKWKLYKDLVEVNSKISGDYGFSPVARMKFVVPKEVAEDPFAKLREAMLGSK